MYPLINIFGSYISTYAVFALLGCICALLVYLLHTRKTCPIGVFDSIMLLCCALIGALVGSKLLYIIVEAKEIFSTEGGIFTALSGGGFVFYGGLIGGICTTYLYCRRAQISPTAFFDSFCAPMCFGHALGRIGCFFAGCCYGCETTLPIGVMYPAGSIAPSGIALLPTQLMESAFLLLLAAALLLIAKKRISGLVSSAYLLCYSCWRFIIEFFRWDDRGSILGLSTSQFISIFLFAAGCIWLLKILSSRNKAK